MVCAFIKKGNAKMKRLKHVIIAVLFVLAVGCNSIEQDVDISRNSKIEDCKLLYDVKTYYWKGTHIQYSTYKYNVAKEDLWQIKQEEYDKVLALSECEGFFDKE